MPPVTDGYCSQRMSAEQISRPLRISNAANCIADSQILLVGGSDYYCVLVNLLFVILLFAQLYWDSCRTYTPTPSSEYNSPW